MLMIQPGLVIKSRTLVPSNQKRCYRVFFRICLTHWQTRFWSRQIQSERRFIPSITPNLIGDKFTACLGGTIATSYIF